MGDVKTRVAVLGIGNPLCQDDGIGIFVVQQMQGKEKYQGVDILDGGTSPDLFSLLDRDVTRLVIVDALHGNGKPGTIYRLPINESHISDEAPISLHGLGVLDSLKLMQKLGVQPPRVTIIGVEPADVSYGLNLSPEIGAIVPDIIKTIEDEILYREKM